MAIDDEIFELGLGPKPAVRLREKLRGKSNSKGEIHRAVFTAFKRAQRSVERKHLVDRMILLRQDKERQEQLFETGQDPYLDVVE